MTRRLRKPARKPTSGLGGMLAFSLALHLVFFFLAARLDTFKNDISTAQTIYVDVVNLPVASPQAGSTAGAPAGATALQTRTAAPATAPAPREMKLPAKHAASKSVTPPRITPKETSQEYEARLAALERSAETRRQEAALAELQHRVTGRTAGTAAAGMPGGTGNQAGSDYGSYIQSRLRDSFALTISWQSKKPLVAVRLTIDAKGNLLSYKIEKSSGDPVFEDAVSRAIQLAKKNFPPPPGGKEFSYGFVFKPEGIDKK